MWLHKIVYWWWRRQKKTGNGTKKEIGRIIILNLVYVFIVASITK